MKYMKLMATFIELHTVNLDNVIIISLRPKKVTNLT